MFNSLVNRHLWWGRLCLAGGENGRSPRRAQPHRRGAGGCAGRAAASVLRRRGLGNSQDTRHILVFPSVCHGECSIPRVEPKTTHAVLSHAGVRLCFLKAQKGTVICFALEWVCQCSLVWTLYIQVLIFRVLASRRSVASPEVTFKQSLVDYLVVLSNGVEVWPRWSYYRPTESA